MQWGTPLANLELISTFNIVCSAEACDTTCSEVNDKQRTEKTLKILPNFKQFTVPELHNQFEN